MITMNSPTKPLVTSSTTSPSSTGRSAERPFGAQQVILPQDVVDGAGTQPLGKRRGRERREELGHRASGP